MMMVMSYENAAKLMKDPRYDEMLCLTDEHIRHNVEVDVKMEAVLPGRKGRN